MRSAYSFSDPEEKDRSKAEAPPIMYSDEQLVFSVCDGDVTRRDKVLEMTYVDAWKWLILKQYKLYAERN